MKKVKFIIIEIVSIIFALFNKIMFKDLGLKIPNIFIAITTIGFFIFFLAIPFLILFFKFPKRLDRIFAVIALIFLAVFVAILIDLFVAGPGHNYSYIPLLQNLYPFILFGTSIFVGAGIISYLSYKVKDSYEI
ncbi:hypothetical protein COY52_04545 [Candidatus Desantisbacteria bacterium CG_4_10_14_0_8_um_filter_48_22]|uniref:Uncharacterized protein n=1 Tax=Candidatus Desantisbacteria bacterium CG_4_10_14_0_8_um_filter_48_22 TaxID=1974543 RepID=A0A2M7SDA6_9BACT|nr:MAG: hypothetical protein AUJ67_02725 [Candidatus Desantisbacteria bacterium CG1_02_49_89]PIV55108.1 MAG: hypothetical protein COS16_08275 [Candidatus Desantisbacteria bacterium CG02_land_8_20_14_3_00_49_13]PIZ17469.1 MAG: hypothetical protein COY52_04545 [Candidatus Desantisbacteria bacterium CG_4_10_14_0_8_um_filter_48_22]